MEFTLAELEDLSIAELVGQMIVVRTSGHLLDRQIQYPVWESKADALQHYVQDLNVGGIIFLGGSVAELAMRTSQIQAWAKYPLLMAADIEEGVGQRFPGATWFPPPMALSAIEDQTKAQEYARQMGSITAQESLAVGLNWILGPIVDVNNNPKNPVINVRAFGETPEAVSSLANAFIAGVADYPVLTCAKHFPGHGDTATDSHLDLPVINHGVDRLRQTELPPFQSAIRAGVDSVMTAHLLIPSLDKDFPATLSHKILTGELRQKMNFGGLIVTDALVMGAIVKKYGAEAASVMAVEAGADIVLMPVDVPKSIVAICQAVRTGKISEEQIRASVARIWAAKRKVFGQAVTSEAFALGAIADQSQAIVTNIHQDSLQTYGELPIEPMGGVNLIIVDEILDCPFLGRMAPSLTVPRELGYECHIINKYTPPRYQIKDQLTILQVFIRGNPFASISDAKSIALDICGRHRGNLQAVIVYGSPYVFADIKKALHDTVPCIFSYGQMPSAQTVALDQLFADVDELEEDLAGMA
jgi:beta-glucosidase